jgi:hypothetical protein
MALGENTLMGSIANRFAIKQMTGNMPSKTSRHNFGRNVTAAAAKVVDEVAEEAARAALKGAYLGNCNVTACQKPGAVWWNTAMRKFYCRSCAKAINAPGWPLGDKTPILCFDRGIYA